MWLPCSVQNFRRIRWIRKKLQTNEVLRDYNFGILNSHSVVISWKSNNSDPLEISNWNVGYRLKPCSLISPLRICLILQMTNISIRPVQCLLYLTGITAAELQWHLTAKYVIFSRQTVFWRFRKKERKLTYGKNWISNHRPAKQGFLPWT